MARYSAVDERIGLAWQVSLPRQCWQCGKTTNLKVTEHRLTLRAFENPIALFSGAAVGIGIGLLLLVVWPSVSTLLLLVLIAAIAFGLLWLKSWNEDVRLAMFTCSEHAGQAPCPEMAIDDQHLHVFLASSEMAAEAREQIQAKRKSNRPAGQSNGESARSGRVADAAPPRYTPPRPSATSAPAELPAATVPLSPDPARVNSPSAELPPIKLAGEEDEPPAM